METPLKPIESITPERRGELLSRIAEYASLCMLPPINEMFTIISIPDTEVQQAYRKLVITHSRAIVASSINQRAKR